MLQYSTYSVISPEGCASILWKSPDKVKDAAEALGMTAPRLLELGLIDKLVREPLGGAHRNPRSMAVRLKAVLLNQLDELRGDADCRPARTALQAPAQLRRVSGITVAYDPQCGLLQPRTNHAPDCLRVTIGVIIRRRGISPWPTTPPSSPY